MKNDILLSVIIPVYNAEAFLDRAVQSVLSQMDESIELILVDDGSVDKSGELCNMYAERNTNIHVIHKENGGTSSAKNMGIKAATGEYITFMDSDDYIDSTAYSNIQQVIKQHKPDCIDFGWRYVSNGKLMAPAFHQLPKNEILDKDYITEWILPPLLNLREDPERFIFDFCCNKVFRTKIIREHNVLFDEDKRVWEDRTFLLRHLKHCETYYAIDDCYYNYVDVPGSLSRRYSLDFFRIILANFVHYSELFGDRFDFDTQYVNNYWSRAIQNMINRSLEETENKNQIRCNIKEALQNQLVVRWFSKRNPKDAFEEKLSQYIQKSDVEQAIRLCERQIQITNRRHSRQRFISKLKSLIKKIIRYNK